MNLLGEPHFPVLTELAACNTCHAVLALFRPWMVETCLGKMHAKVSGCQSARMLRELARYRAGELES